MLKRFLSIVTFLSASLLAAASPLQVVEGELSHDFGIVEQSRKLVYQVILFHSGDNRIELKDVKSSCGGCSPLRLNRFELSPGEELTMTLRLDSGTATGQQRREFYIRVMDRTTSSLLTVETQWEVAPFINCQPAKVAFGSKLYRSTLKRSILVETKGFDPPVRVLSASCPSPHIRLKPLEALPQNTGYRLTFYILPSAPEGRLETEISIETDSSRSPTIVAPVEGAIRGAFQAEKNYLSFGAVQKGKKALVQVDIQSLVGPIEKITRIRTEGNFFTCELQKGKRGDYIVTGKLESGLEKGSYKGNIFLETTCSAQQLITLPVLAIVK